MAQKLITLPIKKRFWAMPDRIMWEWSWFIWFMVMHFLKRDDRVCSFEDGLGFGEAAEEKNLGTREGLSR